MRNIDLKYLFILCGFLVFSACDTEDELRDDIIGDSTNPFEPVVPSGDAGSLDLSKYVAVGNSITAGLMDGALYDFGQARSFPNLLAGQLAAAGGGNFVQPDIDADRGFNVIFNDLSNPSNAVTGRSRLDAVARRPVPLIPGEPITDYTGPDVNNFGVPGARAVDLSVAGYGLANFLFGRFAADQNTSSILGDALAADGTFHTLWIGNNDVLGWVSSGGAGPDGEVTAGAEASPTALTSIANFEAAFNGTLTALTAGGADVAVINIPNILATPLLQAVQWNSIPLDEATATALNEGFAGLNAALDGLVAIGELTQEQADQRKVSYEAGENNPILAIDDSLNDLGDEFDILVGANQLTSEQRAGLEPFLQSRPLTENDLVLILAGLTLGELADPDDPNSAIGIAVPIDDDQILNADEVVTAATRIATFNGIIAAAVAANDNAVLVDANAKFTEIVDAFLAGDPFSIDGTDLFPDFTPNGIFSTDGVHPNPRGHGIIANEVIRAINEEYGASIPEVDVLDLPGVILVP